LESRSLIKILNKEVSRLSRVSLSKAEEEVKKASLKCEQKKIWTINNFGPKKRNVLRVKSCYVYVTEEYERLYHRLG
jgi:hypothetical protein